VFARHAAARIATPTQAQQEDARAYGFLPASPTAIAVTGASYRGPLSAVIKQGKLIPAALESAINSQNTGIVRAVVSRDVWSEDGAQILIPAGTRLIGESGKVAEQGAQRVGVIWHRIARPDGVDVALKGHGVDQLGTSGLSGNVDTRFFARFSGAVLLTLIDAWASEQSNEIQLVGSDAGRSAEIALRSTINLPPTVHVDQGSAIQVFVGQDIDFGHVLGQGLAWPTAAAIAAPGAAP
jgi:type IV secretion system protein VirB10